MSPRWHKIWRDLWSNRGRTILVVMAIAVGVIAFGSVFATKAILLKDMTTQYIASHPASITLSISSGFNDELVRWVLDQPQVSEARGAAQGMVRLYTPAGARNVTLVAADYTVNQVNRVASETGTWPPPNQGIVFERKSADVVGFQLGDAVELELPNGDKKTLTFSGTSHDFQAIPANMFPQLTGYVNFTTFVRLNFPDYYTQLEIVPDSSVITKDDAQTLGDSLKQKLKQRGYESVSVSAVKPGKHWGEDVTNAFVTILTIVGSFSLVLSIFLVVNTITAVIAQQKKQIGIMKAVGGTNRALMTLYLTMTGTYGVLALLVAIPLGAVLSYLNLSLVSNFLNLNVLKFSFPLFIIGLEALAALAVPLIAAAIPVYTGMRVSVREALSDLGSQTTKANPLVDRLTKGLPLLSRPTILSLRNTFRKKTRLILTLVTLTIAGTLFMSVMSVQLAMMQELDNMLLLYNYDIELYFGQSYPSKVAIKQALKTEGITEAETPKYVFGELMDEIKPQEENMHGPPGLGVEVLGLKPESNFMIATLLQGRWIENGDKNDIVISSKMVRDNPLLRPGQELTLKINDELYTFTIVGVFMLPDQKMIVINDKYLGQISPDSDQVNSVRVRTTEHTGPYLADTAKRLEQTLKKSGYDVAYSLTIDTIRSSSVSQFNFMVMFLMMMAGLVAIVGSLSLAGTMSLNVLERTREIGVMRSIGASNQSIRSMVTIESVLVGFLSWLIALPLSIPIGFGFCYAIGKAFFEKPLNFIFPVSGCFIWLGIVVVIAAVASLAPANRAAKLTIRETLAYE